MAKANEPGRLEQLEDQLQELYVRMLREDPTASAEFAELVVNEYGARGGLIEATKTSGDYGNYDEARDELSSLVGLFVAKFLRDPTVYDPSRGGLGAYIDMSLKGDIKNAGVARTRVSHNERVSLVGMAEDGTEKIRDDVEQAAHRRNQTMTVEEEVLDGLDPMDLTEQERQVAMRFSDELSPTDRAVLELMGGDVRETEAYADALGVAHLPVEKQRRAVYAAKDRLKKRIARLR